MHRPVVILPMDGYTSAYDMMRALKRRLASPYVKELVSHIKFNDGLHNYDRGGPEIIRDVNKLIKEAGLSIKIFLDLKICDVSATIVNTLKKYAELKLDILTVSYSCSIEGIYKLRQLLPDTKLAMVSVLTDMDDEECLQRFGQAPAVKIFNDLINIETLYRLKDKSAWSQRFNAFSFVVCSTQELDFLYNNLGGDMGFIVPGIRDEWMLNRKDEHQKRTDGVRSALNKHATFVVMGTQLTKGNPENGVDADESRRRTWEEVKKANISRIVPNDPLATLRACEGYYESPKDSEGKYTGPLVAYAKKYADKAEFQKNMVGFIYLNFAKAEQYPQVRAWFAGIVNKKIATAKLQIDAVIAAPLGGMNFSTDIGRGLNCRTVFAEKTVITPADSSKNVREISRLSLERHELRPGDRVAIVEDVTNNFSTTGEMSALIASQGAELVAVICAFNRSGQDKWITIPVISACDVPLEQYRQDDAEVAEFIAAGQLVLKPKQEWARLEEAMNKP